MKLNSTLLQKLYVYHYKTFFDKPCQTNNINIGILSCTESQIRWNKWCLIVILSWSHWPIIKNLVWSNMLWQCLDLSVMIALMIALDICSKLLWLPKMDSILVNNWIVLKISGNWGSTSAKILIISGKCLAALSLIFWFCKKYIFVSIV